MTGMGQHVAFCLIACGYFPNNDQEKCLFLFFYEKRDKKPAGY